jgi:hypothetical protein
MTRPSAVIVDIDGTVALHALPDGTLTRHHHHYRAVGWDVPNEPVIDVVRALHDAGHRILFCSGRPRFDRQGFNVGVATQGWLTHHVGEWTTACPLFMRPENDVRPDDIVKHEIYETLIKNRYDVRLALDDRDRVVALWRSLGITCLQVAYGDF